MQPPAVKTALDDRLVPAALDVFLCLRANSWGEPDRKWLWMAPGWPHLPAFTPTPTRGRVNVRAAPPRQLPGSLLGFGSGPPTGSHARPSVPLHRKLPSSALRPRPRPILSRPIPTGLLAEGFTESANETCLQFLMKLSRRRRKEITSNFEPKPRAAHLKCI